MNKHKENSPLINIAVVAGILGAISAAIAVHPKGTQIKGHIAGVADDFADALDKTIEKVHGTQKDDEPLDISGFVSSVLTELNVLNRAAEKDVTLKKPAVQVIQDRAGEAVQVVEEKAAGLTENVEDFAHWFQKKGKELARKSLKGY